MILKGTKIVILPLDHKNLESLQWMTVFRDSGVAAFIGPDETCRHEALVASAWNLPMIAFVSLHTKCMRRQL